MHEVDKEVHRIVRKGFRKIVGRRNRALRTDSRSETILRYFSLKPNLSYNTTTSPDVSLK